MASGGDGAPSGADGGVDAANVLPAFAEPAILAPAQPSPRALALDAVDVVWMNDTSPGAVKIARAPRRISSPQGAALAVYGDSVANNGAGLVVTPSVVFWSCYTGEHSVCSSTKTGAAFTPFSTEKLGVSAWGTGVAYGTALYLGASNGVAVTQTTEMTTVTKLDPTAVSFLCADATDLFFVRGTQIVRMSKSGSATAIAVVADAQVGVVGLVLDAQRLYWVVDAGEVRSIDKGASAGAPRTLASAQAGPSSLAIDSASVYWANAVDGTIARVAKDGGAVTTVASSQTTPRLLVGDEAGLAWVNANGDVMGILRRQ